MKRIILLSLFASALTGTVHGQTETKQGMDSDQIQTIFNQTGRIGWWVGPEFSYTMIDKKSAYLGGMSGGIIINHNFSIGLAGMGIMTTNNLRFSGINDTADVYLYGGYGGVRLEYRIKPMNSINIAFPLLIGGGGAAYSTWGPNDWLNYNNYYQNDASYSWDSYFVIEPGINIGLNLIKFMRLDAGVSYRITSGLSLPKTDKAMMNGFNANISLKFGKF